MAMISGIAHETADQAVKNSIRLNRNNLYVSDVPVFHQQMSNILPGAILELNGLSGTRKSRLLLLSVVKMILPSNWNSIPLGLSKSVIYIDYDLKFHIKEIESELKIAVNKHSEFSESEVSKIVLDSLSRLLILRPESRLELLTSLRNISTYLYVDPFPSILMLDCIDTYIWDSSYIESILLAVGNATQLHHLITFVARRYTPKYVPRNVILTDEMKLRHFLPGDDHYIPTSWKNRVNERILLFPKCFASRAVYLKQLVRDHVVDQRLEISKQDDDDILENKVVAMQNSTGNTEDSKEVPDDEMEDSSDEDRNASSEQDLEEEVETDTRDEAENAPQIVWWLTLDTKRQTPYWFSRSIRQDNSIQYSAALHQIETYF